MSDDKKPGLLKRLFGFGGSPEAPTEPPQPEPAKQEPPAKEPKRKEPGDKPAQKEPPGRERPQKSAAAKPRKAAGKPKAPPPAGPHPPGKAEPEAKPATEAPKGTPTPKGPPPSGPAAAPGEAHPEERKPSEREKAKPAGAPKGPAPLGKPKAEAAKVKQGSSPEPKRGWFAQLRQGLARSSAALSDNVAAVMTKRRLDEETLDALEAVLIKSDLGVDMASRIRAKLAQSRHERGVSPEAVREVLAAEIAKVLDGVAKPFALSPARPNVVLIVGVNGTGKTTTAAKLAHQLKQTGSTVLLVAADTFRAAAIDQLKIWGARAGAEVVAREVGADPAGVAFEAVERARAEGTDVVLIDTAGRLQNKSDLMAELAKIVRVIKKLDPAAPHAVVLVLDATTGQNAINQVEIFKEIAGVTSLVVTKLDGTARGGILVAIAERFGIPINAIGIGEGIDDLEPFDAQDFARAIVGLGVKNDAAA